MLEPQIAIQNWVSTLVTWLPFGYAFGAGMVATVNPCGFAMLPAYMAIFMNTGDDHAPLQTPKIRIFRALRIGFMMTLGFVSFFGAAGVIVASGGTVLHEIVPWLALVIGIIFILMGIWLFSGRYFYAGFAARIAAHIGTTQSANAKSFYLFVIAYGIASLSCTLPIFLVVVGSSLTSRGILQGTTQFLSYSLGMGLMVLALTVALALFKTTVVISMRNLLPYFERASAGLLVLAGIYIMYYWIFIGDVLGQIP